MAPRLLLLIAFVATLLLAFALSGPAAAHPPCAQSDAPGHSEYGREHIAAHGPHGHGVGGHNPGTHQGYSLCNPSGKES